MLSTINLRIRETTVLDPPAQLHSELGLSGAAERTVMTGRAQIEDILQGRDPRLLVIVGPCSIHDPEAALLYARELLKLRASYQDTLLIVMRVYFEKPRTSIGWKGLINDPHLDGTNDIATGIRQARKLLLDINELGLPTATEFLDPIVPQYIAGLVSWAAIGARTTESQTHREMASGLSMPVGFKNGTDGGWAAAANAMLAAAKPHSFLGIDAEGKVSVITTTGNTTGHLVLRGGDKAPNYNRTSVRAATEYLLARGLSSRMIVDCSHGNSEKDFRRQPLVAEAVSEQIALGNASLCGVMIESNLVAGRQDLSATPRVFGQSITDGCVDLDTTARMLATLAHSARSRQSSQSPEVSGCPPFQPSEDAYLQRQRRRS